MILGNSFSPVSRIALWVFIVALNPLGCERNPRIVIEYGNPPRFVLAGSGTLNYLRINGPDLEHDANNRQGNGKFLSARKLYWKLVPTNPNRTLDGIGSITYGQVPEGFTQAYPENGSPLPLVEGDLYNAHLEPNDSHSYNAYFAIREGKILAVGQK